MALGEKGQVTDRQAGGVTLTAQIVVREPTRDEWRASELLKEATARHDDKDFDGAVGCLREAYALLADSSTSYPIATYLRLPLYLQKARRLKEAELEFEALLTSTHASIARDDKHLTMAMRKGFVATERAAIYKAMCTTYKREGDAAKRLLFGLLAHASECAALKYREYYEELASMCDQAKWAATLDKLLKGSEPDSRRPAILDACLAFSKACTDVAVEKLDHELRGLILGPGSSAASPATTFKRGIEEGAQAASDEDLLVWLEQATRAHLEVARAARQAGDFETAREEYLKTAQALAQFKGEEWAKASLRQEQTDFARDDPLYQGIVAAVRPIVQAEPGILQTALYSRLPFDRGDVGYALYFANEVGDIRRRKKGRTYEIFPGGHLLNQ